MIVMGGIIGAGIFMNPYVVARQVHTPALIFAAWTVGGLIALAGAFIYAELSCHSSLSGGQYIYLRDAFHPGLAFIYGWSLLLVIQTGGMAATAVTFARYASSLSGNSADGHVAAVIAAAVLIVLTLINCFGVRAGSTTQNIFMLLKLVAIAMLIGVGVFWVKSPVPSIAANPSLSTVSSITAFGAALIPVQFAYGGWQTTCFVAGEVRSPRNTLPRGLLIGVLGVILIYLSVNIVCVRALGAANLAHTTTPATAVMEMALGRNGARIIAFGIALSTVGFLSQSMLTAPRVYFAMAEDKLFFKNLARLNRAQVPAAAIALQGALAIVIALSGRYEQILNYVVSVDVVFFALSAACVFVFRRHRTDETKVTLPIPGHPFTTLLFIAACVGVVLSTLWSYPKNSVIGLGIALSGLPMYLFWKNQQTRPCLAHAVSSGQAPDRSEQSERD
jgi:basic amino acid/polyamine antiporter, APA family